MSAQGDIAATPDDEAQTVVTDPDGTDPESSGGPSFAGRVRTVLAGGTEPLTRRQRTWIIAIVAVAGALRLAWALYAAKEPHSLIYGGDAYAYLFHGKNIAAGDGYVNVRGTGDPTAYYPIGYPALLGALFWVVQHTPIPDNLPMASALMNVVLSTASVFLVFAIGRRLFGARVGLVAATIFALFPNIIYYVATLQLETLFIFLSLLLVLYTVSHDWRTGMPSRTWLLGFGALLGIVAEVRPFVLPFLAGLGIAALAAGLGRRKALVAMAWPLLALVVVCIPWTVRNAVVMDAFVPFSTNGGDTLCMDRGPGADGKFRWAVGPACADPDADEVTRNSVGPRRALKYTVQHPDEELVLIGKRFWHMMAEDHDGLRTVETGKPGPFLGDRVRTTLARVADVYFFAAGLLALAGMAAFFRGRRPDRVFTGFAIITLLVLPLFLWGNVRFHVPLLPFIALAAAVSLTTIWDRLRPARHPDPADPDPDEQASINAEVVAGTR
jgi:4-amino-4-deoxy-L-arabinose transferase-like glycosyltransferase